MAIRAALALTELLLGPLDLSSYWLIIAVIIAHGMCAAALARLFTSNSLVLDAPEIYAIGRELDR